MSCSTLCPCQLNWPLDTHGSKRDTIASEKSWLDFAVRYLSREAAGKGNGKETVWSEQFKPSWWDAEVGLPWKNPTTNLKDNKDTLLTKYEALEKHLRVENKFPIDLEEEAKLWALGKSKELFLLCNLTCLLGKVTGVHSAIIDACTKADKMQAQINQTVIKNIRNCLNSALKATESFKGEETPKCLKRSRNNTKGNTEYIPSKKLNQNPTHKKQFVNFHPKRELNSVTPDATKSEDILKYANRILGKRKNSSDEGKIRVAEKLLKSYHTKHSEPKLDSYPQNTDSTSSLPVEMLESKSSSSPDPVSICSSTSSPTSFSAELEDNSNEIDFLLSPSPALPKEILNDSSCLYIHKFDLPNLSDLAQEENNCSSPDENHAPLEDVLNTVSNDIYLNANDSLLNPVGMDVSDNNPSPGSISSETHSCPQTSDGGYISADDLNLDIHEYLVNEEEHCSLWDDKGSYSLEIFLFDSASENSNTGPDVSLLDQWGDINSNSMVED